MEELLGRNRCQQHAEELRLGLHLVYPFFPALSSFDADNTKGRAHVS
jgi:hypothetical protein